MNISYLVKKLTRVLISSKIDKNVQYGRFLMQFIQLHSFYFISNGPTSLFILSVAYKPLLIKQNECTTTSWDKLRENKVNYCAHDCISSVPNIWKAINPGTFIIAEIQNAICHPDIVFSPLISLPVAKMKKKNDFLSTIQYFLYL